MGTVLTLLTDMLFNLQETLVLALVTFTGIAMSAPTPVQDCFFVGECLVSAAAGPKQGKLSKSSSIRHELRTSGAQGNKEDDQKS